MSEAEASEPFLPLSACTPTLDRFAKDVSGNGKDGTLAGSPLPVGVPGHIGGAISFSGAQKQYVQIPNNIFQGRNGVSISSLLKLSQALAWDRLFDFNGGEISQ